MKTTDLLPAFLDIALPLLRLPTAPFYEHHIVAVVPYLVVGWGTPRVLPAFTLGVSGHTLLPFLFVRRLLLLWSFLRSLLPPLPRF